MTIRVYLASVPERIIRSVLGVTAGVARELGEVAVPAPIRGSQLYRNIVDATLRFVIEQVGGAEAYRDERPLPDDFLARRTAGNAIEALGVVAFRASPVWVLALLADVCGAGRYLIPQIADALKERGLLEQEASFSNMDTLLDGLKRTASRLAGTINAPPLDVAGLRAEWAAIRAEAQRLPDGLPSKDTVHQLWTRLKTEAARQDRSIFETSSMLALAAAQAVPDNMRWLSTSARVGVARTGQVLAGALLDHYRQTLTEIHQVGYAAYASRQLRPYLRAVKNQFSPKRRTLTERLIGRFSRSPQAEDVSRR
jgi:hypothetical protein